MKLLSINFSLASYFPSSWQIKNLALPGGIIDISRHPQVKDYKPDLIIQQENLGPRTLLLGLSSFSCPKIFWSIDTHLNFFWHKIYGKNFDLVFTTQPTYVSSFQKEGIESSLLLWYGQDIPYKSWPSRKHKIGFSGRVNEYRILRKRLLSFLKEEFGAAFTHKELPFEEMLRFYRDTQIIVNEAITGEINFRTFEATSCGCLLFTPELKEPLEYFFEPEKEHIVYIDGLELKEKLQFYLKNPDKAELIAKKGYEKLRKKHLPLHRVKKILKIFSNLTCKQEKRDKEEKRVIMSLYFLWQNNNNISLTKQNIEDLIKKIPVDEEVVFILLELNLLDKNKVEEILFFLIQSNLGHSNLELNLVASLAAGFWNNLELSKFFIFRYKKNKVRAINSLRDVYLFWTEELIKQGILFRTGFLFDPARHLPRSALECLQLLLLKDTKDQEVLKLLRKVLKEEKGTEDLLLKVESQLGLLKSDDWELGVSLAQTNWKNFRLKQGLEEFVLALQRAKELGLEEEFWLRVRSKKIRELLSPGGYYA